MRNTHIICFVFLLFNTHKIKGLTIVYIQDILVLNAYQNKGIASELLQRILNKYKNVRQKVLLTEEASGVRYFYEKNGFESCDQGLLVAFAKMN
ncbi:GNAT family N-acetyltransferase [Weissella paramesenteroides]|uniref:GNAT family N-acetyltransferase n=1 Tax=Weissella paramesenteroides TaxID=1249 RepID=UPI0020741E5C|nr:GNAT family N-acetyltransferase [Weissella paramesenteroides]